MNDAQLDDLLALLFVVVIADRKILDEEIEAFADTAYGLRDVLELETPLTRGFLMNWLKSNRERIIERLSNQDINSVMAKLFFRLKPLNNKHRFLESMLTIAVSDGELHVDEKVLISLAAMYWGLGQPEILFDEKAIA